jgi:hypothetical protein
MGAKDMTQPDGGPAFPTRDGVFNGPVGGMSLRDYFAAHAPAECLWCFDVKMPTPRPKPDYGDDPDNKPECAFNFMEVAAWDNERRRKTRTQWPWVWADAMIAERPQK